MAATGEFRGGAGLRRGPFALLVAAMLLVSVGFVAPAPVQAATVIGPVTVSIPRASAATIAIGWNHVCIVKSVGTIACWGANGDGQATPPSGTHVAIAGGMYHNCAIKTDGTLDCWGFNDSGQANPPVGTFIAVTAGLDHSCAITTGGLLTCWGSNAYGQTSAPAGTYVALSAGDRHTCAIKTDATLACWGRNNVGQAAPPAGTFVSVSGGNTHTCAIKTDGTLACWGANDYGQATPPAGTFEALAGGDNFTCAIKTDGTLACWGYNVQGEATPPGGTYVGIESGGGTCAARSDGVLVCWSRPSSAIPQPIPPDFTVARRNVTGGSAHTCTLRNDGTILCWGSDSYGQSDPPIGTFTAVGAGFQHSCAIRTNGTLGCWGDNARSQLNAPAGGTYASVAAGGYHNCAVTVAGSLQCWGYNYYGQATVPSSGGPWAVASAGLYFSCALAVDGTLACWGSNSGGAATPPSGTFLALASGAYHSCAIKTDGTLACWGQNGNGQATPPSGTFIAVSAGQYHSCAIRTSGTLQCWGQNTQGQATPPGGTYVRLGSGAYHNCAVASDNGVTCWGLNSDYQTTVPTPGAPRNLYATPGNASAFVFWDPPIGASSGVLTYTVTSSPDGRTCVTTTTSCTITGLANGLSYTFTAVADNSFHTSGVSFASAGIDVGAPTIPAGITATAGNASALVTWMPSDSNGSPVTGYTVTSDPDGLTCTSASTGCIVTGLTNGTWYSFEVTATNANGTSPASAPSEYVGPSASPGSPTGVSAVAHPGSATVSWSAPASDGGSAITGYTVTSYPGGYTCTATVTTSCTVAGLTNGTSYTFTVTATNGVGTGIPSSPSSPVTPAAAPSKPTGAVAAAGDGAAQVQWNAAAPNGSPISSYVVTSSPGGLTCSTAGTYCTVAGLANYTAYTFTVVAYNGIGPSPASDATAPAMPSAAPATVVVASSASVTAGNALSVTVTVRDGHGATAAAYRGTVTFGSSDPAASLPATYTFTAADAGIHAFTVTLKTAGSQAVTVADVMNTSVSGAMTGISVQAAQAATLSIAAPGSFAAGVGQPVTVRALDQFGNVAAAYAGTVHFTSSDPAAVLPSDYAFVAGDGGVHLFSVSLRTAGTRSISATDTATSSISGTRAGISVVAGPVVALAVPTTVTWDAGVSHTVYVIARDAYGNTAKSYAGTVHFSSSDLQAALPPDYTFVPGDRGVHAFSVILKTAGTRSISAADTLTPSINGSQTGIAVRPAAVRAFSVVTSTSWTAGAAHSFYVTVNDPYGNRVTNYAGTVHFTSSDPQAVLPSDYTFGGTDHGYHVFSVTLRSAGARSVTVTDYAGVTGSVGGIGVTAGSAKTIAIAGPSVWPAGSTQSVTLTVRDAYGNTVTGYRGTVHFTSTDPAAVLPADYAFSAGDNGVHTFTVTLTTAGIQSITAADTTKPTLGGTLTGISVT